VDLLERRLRNSDSTIEVHIVSFDSDQNFQRFRSDPRRACFAHLIEASAAKNELLAMTDVASGASRNVAAPQNSIAIGGKPTRPDLLSARFGRD
jgi:hypothetical protein